MRRHPRQARTSRSTDNRHKERKERGCMFPVQRLELTALEARHFIFRIGIRPAWRVMAMTPSGRMEWGSSPGEMNDPRSQKRGNRLDGSVSKTTTNTQ